MKCRGSGARRTYCSEATPPLQFPGPVLAQRLTHIHTFAIVLKADRVEVLSTLLSPSAEAMLCSRSAPRPRSSRPARPHCHLECEMSARTGTLHYRRLGL